MKTKRIFSVILSVALILSLANVGFAVTADGGSAPTYQAEALTGDNQISVAANYIAAAGASAISTVGNGGFPSGGDKNNMLDGNLDTWSNWNGIGDLGYMIVDLGEAKKMNAFDLGGLPIGFPTWYLPGFKIYVVNDDSGKEAVLNG